MGGKISYDVAVVGAGPSGSQCARLLAERGYRVILLEKHSQPRTHIICTGIIGSEGFFRFNLPRSSVLHELSEARLVSPGGLTLEYSTGAPFAYIVDRTKFDSHLQSRAASQGAHVCYGFQAESFKEDSEGISVVGRMGDDPSEVHARLAVFANGADPRLARRLGLAFPDNAVQGVQAEARIRKLDRAEVYFGRRIAPGFFAWVVPIGEGRARVGLLSRTNSSKHFREFLRSDPLREILLEEPAAISCRPIGQGLLQKTAGARFLVLGEAAGQVKTSTGGGIYYGLRCAELAAQVVDDVLRAGEISNGSLQRYHNLCVQLLKGELEAGLRLQRLGGLLKDTDIDFLFHLIGSNGLLGQLRRRVNFDWHETLIDFLLRHPSLTGVLRTLTNQRFPAAQISS